MALPAAGVAIHAVIVPSLMYRTDNVGNIGRSRIDRYNIRVQRRVKAYPIVVGDLPVTHAAAIVEIVPRRIFIYIVVCGPPIGIARIAAVALCAGN